MGKLKIHETPMNGLYVVETEPFVDHRGAFARWFCEEELAEVIGERRIKNVNFSQTAKVKRWVKPKMALYGWLGIKQHLMLFINTFITQMMPIRKCC